MAGGQGSSTYRVALAAQDVRLLYELLEVLAESPVFDLGILSSHPDQKEIEEQRPQLAARLAAIPGPAPIFSMTRVERLVALLALDAGQHRPGARGEQARRLSSHIRMSADGGGARAPD